MELLNPTLKNKKKSTLTKFLIFQEMEISNIFSKESFSYFSGNGNLEKIPYISGNELFYFLKNRNHKKISCISGTKLSYILGYGNPKKKFYISGYKLSSSKKCKKTKNTFKMFVIFREMELFYFLKVSKKKLHTLHHNILHQDYCNKFLCLQ